MTKHALLAIGFGVGAAVATAAINLRRSAARPAREEGLIDPPRLPSPGGEPDVRPRRFERETRQSTSTAHGGSIAFTPAPADAGPAGAGYPFGSSGALPAR